MAFEKGNKKRGGRQKGTSNKTTQELKEIITRVVGNQLDRLEKDLDMIRKTNPAKAVEISSKLIDYVLPKQQKIDLEGKLQHKVEKVTIQIIGTDEDGDKHKDN